MTTQPFSIPSSLHASMLRAIENFSQVKLLVVGDCGLDEYIQGDVRRISPEAPVPVLEVKSEELKLGLSANVAQNVVTLGGQVEFISVVGNDQGAELIKGLLSQLSIKSDGLVVDSSRPTIRKMRAMSKHHQMLRIDFEDKQPMSLEIENQLIANIETRLESCQMLILQDYAKGLISSRFVQRVDEICKAQKKPWIVDPYRSHSAEFYKGCYLIKPNYEESLALGGYDWDEVQVQKTSVETIAGTIQQKTGATHVVVTQGREGMCLSTQGQPVASVPTYARQVADVTGAGDTVIAALALALQSGLSLKESAHIANFAAGVVVGQVGCVPCTVAELMSFIDSHRA